MTRRHLTAFVGLSLAVASCVPNKLYRPGTAGKPDEQYVSTESLKTRQFEPAEVNDDSEWRYRLAFVEFDDQGELFKRDQLTRAVAEIGRAKQDARRSAEGRAIVAVFVHGWKNNASDSSGNVWGFRQVLGGLAKQYDNAPVVGVYIGWRGAVLSPPILKELTFFDRQRKSQNLAGAHLVEALLTIMQAAKGAAYADPEPSTATVLIGHSFGGAVLETALSQTLLGLAVQAKSTGTMRWPANLVVLVNEAQEATRSYQLIEAFKENLPARDGQGACVSPADRGRIPEPPALVSISSTGDTATRVAFTAIHAVQRPFTSLRKYDQPNFLGLKRQTSTFLHATAHMKEFQSHLLGRQDDPAIVAARALCKPSAVTTIGGVTYTLVEKPGAKNRTPYWALQMPPAIVPDHSTIFTPVFRNLVLTLLLRTTQPLPPAPPVIDTKE